ncbi:Dyp-type peroxidase [Motiliproteus coralliicola]|uniref:Dyp-type peroxidase n=1 Tax=Motiliproteus coralliicola TaxID=2283196 RepID=A0A369W8Z9_9GAMM|nr:Dyp-type peroxidase [Motiliproteus coralliicola]RDE18127.1 Dyp-type peroxidase [Motiliproteus coralliicola]
MSTTQPGILDPLPSQARYLTFDLLPDTDPASLKQCLQNLTPDQSLVVGLGTSLINSLEGYISGLKPFPSLSNQGIDIPSTNRALWLWLRGEDRGELLHQQRRLCQQLADCFELTQAVDSFLHADGHDLTGYEDGTENPEGEEAVQAAFSRQTSLEGSSFVAVQQWVHDFNRFDAMSTEQQDDCIGRRRSDNVEFEGSPASAHVKRTAQESFTPEAFVLRRSMPWSSDQGAGLMFVAFGHSLAPFEAQLIRMMGLEDGITDALFKFTRPVTGSYYWCPALEDGKLDLSPLEN